MHICSISVAVLTNKQTSPVKLTNTGIGVDLPKLGALLPYPFPFSMVGGVARRLGRRSLAGGLSLIYG